MTSKTDDVNISRIRPLLPPACLLDEIPISPEAEAVVLNAREEVQKILTGEDDRLIVVVGPCSIHDTKIALEYAESLLELKKKHEKDLCILMRVYFEKPRTTVGWKGLINDPDLDGSFNINQGLRVARQLLLELNEIGLPSACEFLDTISPQYIADLVSWGAIGARTTESQCHRELASGISCAVGFKNGTSGNIQVAVDGVRAARHPHSFLSVTKHGIAAIVQTSGNPFCHVILRGGQSGTNYEEEHVTKASTLMTNAKLHPSLMIDCSHGNSLKDHKRQPLVVSSVCSQVASGCLSINGVMIESNINEGNQALPSKVEEGKTIREALKYGVSVTDACINLETTKNVLEDLAEAVNARRKSIAA